MSQPTTTYNLNDFALAHALVRVGLGLNFLGHGLGRINQIPGFADHLGQLFGKTFLPIPVVTATAYAIPPLELAMGLALTAGWYFRPTLVVALLFMALLSLGATIAQQYEAASEQLLYILVLGLLLASAELNRYSLDAAKGSKKTRFIK